MHDVAWIVIFVAAAVTVLSRNRWLSFSLLVIGYGMALADGLLGLAAFIPLALLMLAAYIVHSPRLTHVRYAGHVLFVVVAIALSVHWLPGFHNSRVIGPERFTADAVPFTMYLNLDKPLIGFWLVLVLPWIQLQRPWRAAILSGMVVLVITAAACLSLATWLELVAWAPKSPADSLLFLVNNLLLVSFAEEALFRGYLQAGLARLFKDHRYASALAISTAAFLFGLAHLFEGWQWAAVGGVAGVGYGLAYHFGGLRTAIMVHFGVNALHFFLFTYPMLQSTVQG
ncbi:CPBP family intramembrane glutamic endopeptidase [Robbsia andropogonis]|uniref:CPBP family intramembrane glutamic endopeptidase n=1 Tax=Robbsia andropogonis TaxID=28092 RepID=UPI0020A0FDF9|nr:CPBP family intramembrane glutamic endopeptidase [Robbsia andropogonis]MCP1119206.1 CPBP family intramembrane metalloprotease [Robbsia andropogonis]MCP1128943.1 CPBP family intramembrane metalloprotease [Robbsia andropogonis]